MMSTEDNSLFDKMDVIRYSLTCTLDERIKYCQFWVCMAAFMKRYGITSSPIQLWFTVDGYESDCYWVELLFHLSHSLGIMHDSLVSGERAWDKMNVPQTMLQLKKLIGCCLYLETEGLQFQSLEGETYRVLREAYVSMVSRKEKVRLMCLRMIAYTAEKDSNTKECILFCSACLEEDPYMDDMRIMLAKASSKLALQQGLFSESLRLLKECHELGAEYQVMADALGISFANTESTAVFLLPRSAHKLLVKGDSPLTSSIYARLMKSEV